MSSPEEQLKRIQEKLQLLLKQHTAMQKENNRLVQELQSAEEKLKAQQKQAEDLKQQVGILKLNAGEMSAEDKKEFEKRITRYIKEIDRCIAMLGE